MELQLYAESHCQGRMQLHADVPHVYEMLQEDTNIHMDVAARSVRLCGNSSKNITSVCREMTEFVLDCILTVKMPHQRVFAYQESSVVWEMVRILLFSGILQTPYAGSFIVHNVVKRVYCI